MLFLHTYISISSHLQLYCVPSKNPDDLSYGLPCSAKEIGIREAHAFTIEKVTGFKRPFSVFLIYTESILGIPARNIIRQNHLITLFFYSACFITIYGTVYIKKYIAIAKKERMLPTK